MTIPLYLSRARLRRDVPDSALRALLQSAESARVTAAHKVVWKLFGDTPDRARDFLWREAEPGLFYLLSRRAPDDRFGLFDVDPPKPFLLSLTPGDRLRFALRANATVARGGGPGRRGKPCDVVMDALHDFAPGQRGAERRHAVEAAGGRWLSAQGERAGFSVGDPADVREHRDQRDAPEEAGAPGGRAWVRVAGYRTLRLDRPGNAARLGILDFEGVLEVRDPALFVPTLERGFGRAKAFGCGLMLIRRA